MFRVFLSLVRRKYRQEIISESSVTKGSAIRIGKKGIVTILYICFLSYSTSGMGM